MENDCVNSQRRERLSLWTARIEFERSKERIDRRKRRIQRKINRQTKSVWNLQGLHDEG